MSVGTNELSKLSAEASAPKLDPKNLLASLEDIGAGQLKGSLQGKLESFESDEVGAAVDDLLAKHADGSVTLDDSQLKGLAVLQAAMNTHGGSVEKNNEKAMKAARKKLDKQIKAGKFTPIQEKTLYVMLDKHFSNAKTPQELEEYFGISLAVIDSPNRLLEALTYALDHNTPMEALKNFADICYQKGLEISYIVEKILLSDPTRRQDAVKATLDWIYDISHSITTGRLEYYHDIIASGVVKWNEFASWSVDKYDSTKELFDQTTEKLLLEGELAWNAVADFCTSNRELLGKWFTETTEKLLLQSKIVWNTVADFCASNRELLGKWFTETTEKLLLESKIVWNVVADFCANNRELLGKWFTETTEKLVLQRKIVWNAVADFCVNNRESLGKWFTETTEKLISGGELAWETFVQWGKDKGEMVEKALISVAKGLLEAGEITLKAIVGGFLLAGFAMVVVAGLLIEGFKYTGEKLAELGKGLAQLMYDAGVGIGEIFVFLYEKAKIKKTNTLDRINDVVKDTKIVFSTLLELGKIQLNEGLNWLSLKYRDFVSMWKDIKERGNIQINDFMSWVGSSWQLLRVKTKQFTENVASFVDYLVSEGMYTVDQIGKFFVATGRNISDFFNYIIESGTRGVDAVIAWFESSYKTLESAYDKMLELGISTRNLLGEKMYKAGIAVETIARLVLKRVDVKANQLCDLFFDLYGRSREKIQSIISVVAKAIRNQRDTIMNWALDKYSKYLDAKQALLQATLDAKNWMDAKVSEIGDWLLSKGVEAQETAKLLVHNFKDNVKSVEKYITDRADRFTSAYNKWKGDVRSKVDDITNGAGQWLIDLI